MGTSDKRLYIAFPLEGMGAMGDKDRETGTSPESRESDAHGRSKKLFLEFLSRRESGEQVTQDEFIKNHPAFEAELQKLFDEFKEGHQVKVNLDASDNATDNINRVVGDFRIIREIGQGGMGTVYEAKQISLNRKVALKVLPSHLSFSDEAVMKFKREAEAGGRQHHPGIVAIHSVGEHEGVHYIAQELVADGMTLSDRLDRLRKEKEQPPGYFTEVAQLISEIALALQHAHDSGVIHRDIKPSNILLNEEGQSKVTDFGLAKVEDALALSRTGDFAGTPYYMSPEQAASSRIGIDTRTDIFSLGVTLYEMLTLRRPFEGKTSQEVLKKILLRDPADPRKTNRRVPRDLSVICLKAMEKEPERRYQSMDEFSTDLQQFLSGNEILAKPTCAVVRLIKRIRRNPSVSIAWISSLLAAAALVVVMVILYDRFDEETFLASVEICLNEDKGDIQVLQEFLSELCLHEGEVTGKNRDRMVALKQELDKQIRYGMAAPSLSILDAIELRRPTIKDDLAGLDKAITELSVIQKKLPEEEYDRAATLKIWLILTKYLAGPDDRRSFTDNVLSALNECRDDVLSERVRKKRLENLPGPAYLKEETFSCGGQTNTVKIYRHDKTGLEFVLVPGGTFNMGSPESESGRRLDEGPQHWVTIKPFLICRTECTQEAWDRVGGNDERQWHGTTLPIEFVSWNDCTAWCHEEGLRLPTEAEWEYACRSRTSGRFCFGESDSGLDDHAWYFANTSPKTNPVAKKKPNAFGLFDMHGNLWEWCEDTWQSDYTGAPTDGTAWVDSGSSDLVFRGGSWNDAGWVCRSANRGKFHANHRSSSVGFRPAYSLPETE